MKIMHHYTGEVLFEDESLDMGTTLQAAIKANADLCGADLRNQDLRRLDMTNGRLSHALFDNSTLDYAKLDNADFGDASFKGANLYDVSAVKCNLRHANFFQALLIGASFEGVDLSYANLTRSILSTVTLKNVCLSYAHFAHATFSDTALIGATLRDGAVLETARPLLQIDPIGSRQDTLVIYNTNKGLYFDIGCQRQISQNTFEERIEEFHPNNVYARDYRAAIAMAEIYFETYKE